MHSYLRSIGFSEITKEMDLFPYLQMTIESPDLCSSYEKPDGEVFVEFKKEFGYRIGLAVCGSYYDENSFHIEYYYPFFWGINSSTNEDIEIERHADKNSFAGICDDVRLGITLIYYLQNISDFFHKTEGKMFCRTGTTVLSALSTEGKIILPVVQADQTKRNHFNELRKRTNMISAAREGDEEAIDNLTMEDIDVYAMLSRRVENEDLMTIVDTCLMPYGIESDQYAVVGEIINTDFAKNTTTGESLVFMTVNSKDIIYDICINQKDLLGEPEIGRRFKGKIWMQGLVRFS